jgi:ABC-2 type transport system ATP-binding protein
VTTVRNPRESDAAIAVEGLTVRYGKSPALDSVRLRVEPGSVYALLGRNGAGKTSLIRCLLGHRKPEAGRALCFGLDCWDDRVKILSRMAVVPEEPDAPREMTTRKLGGFFASLYPGWDEKAFWDHVSRFAIPIELPFKRLSKGQKTQLNLTLAMASRPEILVLDDPTLGLDAVARRAILEEIVGELADRETTVLITSHDLAGIEGIAQRVGILKDGKLILDESLESVKDRFRKVVLTGGERPAMEKSLEPLRPLKVASRPWGTEGWVQGFSETAFDTLRKSPAGDGAEASPMSLEEVFIALVGEEGGAL